MRATRVSTTSSTKLLYPRVHFFHQHKTFALDRQPHVGKKMRKMCVSEGRMLWTGIFFAVARLSLHRTMESLMEWKEQA